MRFPRFDALCEAAHARGLHTELHVGDVKGEKGHEYRDITHVRVGRPGTFGKVRATSWATLDGDAEALHEELVK